MEYIDVKKMLNDQIEEKLLEVVSESFKEKIKVSFYGYTEGNKIRHSDYYLYFLPIKDEVHGNDILEYYRETYYGFCYANAKRNSYIINLNKLPKDCNFLDLYGDIFEFELQENTVLELETENHHVGFFDFEEPEEKTIFLGKRVGNPR